jgi:hypothetical protein
MKKVVLGLALLAFLPSKAPAQDLDSRTRDAVSRGIDYLVAHQNPNGSWNDRVGYVLSGEMYGEATEAIYSTSVAGLALVAAGHVPGRGKYGPSVERAVNWVSSKIREDGYITHAGSRMYEHALATIFLAEMVGMTKREDLKRVVKRSIHLLVDCQNKQGGWRHQPVPIDADLTVTALVVQALRAARNVGISVPQKTVEAARKFVESCATRRGYAYQPEDDYGYGGRTTYAMTGCGIVSMYSLGGYDTAEVRRAIGILGDWRHPYPIGRTHYFFGHYFAVQAFYIAGGDAWSTYYPRVKEEILRLQEADGRWADDVGVHYATAMACLILQVPSEYLNLFQK